MVATIGFVAVILQVVGAPAFSAQPHPAPEISATTTGASNPTNSTNNLSAWQIALASAVSGSILTVIFERLVILRRDNKALGNYLSIVKLEVEENTEKAKLRESIDPEGSFPFYSPLSVTSWDGLRSSGLAWKMLDKPHTYATINQFYTEVENANYLNSLATEVFALSQQDGTPQEDRIVYLDQAMNMVIRPYATISLEGQKALECLNPEEGRP